VTAAASAFDGKLVCRMLAADGWPLRRQIARALAVLRRNEPLPRVWQI
jgi:urease accessory protein